MSVNAKPTLLIVAHEQKIIDLLKRQLAKHNYDLKVVYSAEDALECLASQSISVVIADANTDDIHCTTFFLQVRECSPTTTSIALTGNVNLHDVLDSIKEGHVNSYLAKPWQQHDLELAVINALKHRAILAEKDRFSLEMQQQRTIVNTLKQRLSAQMVELEHVRTLLYDSRQNAEIYAQERRNIFVELQREINTIVGGTQSMISILAQDNLSEEQQEIIHTIRLANEDISALLNDMMDSTRLAENELELNQIEFDLIDLTEHAFAKYVAGAEKKALGTELSIHPDMPRWVKGDPTRLRFVIEHLLSNAVKYTYFGGIKLQMGVIEDNSDTAVIRCRVIDTGCGFAADAEQGASIEQLGSQLGLILCKRLVAYMKGTFGFHSLEDEGTTFWFEMPLEISHEVMHNLTFHEDFSVINALIIDDSESSRLLTTQMLKSFDVDNIQAVHSNVAIETMNQAVETPNLLIISSETNNNDPFTLLKDIKAHCKTNAFQTIMLASQAERGDAQQAHEQYVDAYLSKPVQVGVFHDCIAVVMAMDKGCEHPLITSHVIRTIRKSSMPQFRALGYSLEADLA